MVLQPIIRAQKTLMVHGSPGSKARASWTLAWENARYPRFVWPEWDDPYAEGIIGDALRVSRDKNFFSSGQPSLELRKIITKVEAMAISILSQYCDVFGGKPSPGNKKPLPRTGGEGFSGKKKSYFTCDETSLVISNMVTWDLPPKMGLRSASALMLRLFLASCRLFFLM